MVKQPHQLDVALRFSSKASIGLTPDWVTVDSEGVSKFEKTVRKGLAKHRRGLNLPVPILTLLRHR